MTTENCANCRNGKPNEFGYVRCRWRPPLFVREEDIHWPMTRSDDWCSQWTTKGRRIVQIMADSNQIIALADDDTIWHLSTHGWRRLADALPVD